jgi:hypothetical protein
MKKKLLGLALIASTSIFANNLVLNGDFATGDFTDWTVVYGSNLTVSCASGLPFSGCVAQFGSTTPDLNVISQSISTLPKTNYEISFFLKEDGIQGDSPPNKFVAQFGNTTLLQLDDENAFDWQHYTLFGSASSTNILLQFSGRNFEGYFYLGDITILPLSLPLSGLKGNDLNLANYLNANAPADVVGLLSYSDDLTQALQSAAPTRNAFSTYASQTTQLSLERLVNDHLGQQRWRNNRQASPTQTAALESTESLMAESDVIAMNDQRKAQSHTECCCENKKPVSVWLGAFGEFAQAKPKHQTPDFNTSSGGVVVASDYNGVYPHPIGAGAAYAHTYIHENEDAGHANIDQGGLFIYSSFPVANWYFDTTVWGGYYYSKNVREISFSNFPGGEAKCKIHGWQLSPHIEIGYDHSMNWLGLEPFIMADYVGCWEHGANESGSTPLNFGQKDRYCSLVRGEAGLRLQEILSYCWGSITFKEKGSYAYQKALHSGKINAFLIGSPGSFTVSTLTTAQNLGVGEVEALFKPKNTNFYASLAFHTEIGSKYQAYQGMVRIDKDF